MNRNQAIAARYYLNQLETRSLMTQVIDKYLEDYDVVPEGLAEEIITKLVEDLGEALDDENLRTWREEQDRLCRQPLGGDTYCARPAGTHTHY